MPIFGLVTFSLIFLVGLADQGAHRTRRETMTFPIDGVCYPYSQFPEQHCPPNRYNLHAALNRLACWRVAPVPGFMLLSWTYHARVAQDVNAAESSPHR